MILSSLVGILILCLTHVFANKLHLSNIPRSKWLSVAGGISVTYIFLQSLPELQEFQEILNHEAIWLKVPGFEEFEIYLIALLGLAFFYGLENKSRKSFLSRREPNEGEEVKNNNIFRIHLFSFAVYNFIIGYLLLGREDSSMLEMLVYTIAMAFHFIVTDHSLEDHFSRLYRKRGRWILVLSLIIGWGTSLLTTIPEVYIGLVFAILAGGIIMNVLKEELPKERESNFLAFLSGIVVYSVVLAFI